MKILGVDTSTLPDQFNNATVGRVLIVDGDGPCYVVASTVKRLDTAVRRYQQEILKRMFLTSAEHCRVHLTAHDSDKFGRFRVLAEKPYQGQRKGKAKPALLEPLREAMADPQNWLPEFEVFLHRDVEADDAMITDAYLLGENGVVWSEDKDLRMTPYPYWEIDKGQIQPSQPDGWVSLKCTPSGTQKLVGQGPMFFWGQMLCGDTADNVKGLREMHGHLIGPAGAFQVLENIQKVECAADRVVSLYREIDQNVLAEGWLMWLKRSQDDNIIKYLRELDLTLQNKAFIQDCLRRRWVLPRAEKEKVDLND